MVQEVMCRYSHPEKITTVQILLQIGYAIAKSMLNFMVQSCKTMHSEIITQIWKCSLFTSFAYNIYNRIERITCPSLSAIWNPDFAKFWLKKSLFGPWIQAKKKTPRRVRKKISLVVSQTLIKTELENTLGFKKTDLKSNIYSNTQF